MIGFLLAAALSAAPVIVQPGEQPAYEAFLKETAIKAAETFGGGPCPGAEAQILADASGVGEDPSWRLERVKVVGCGPDTVENLEVRRLEGGERRWQAGALLPGESLAKPGLQKEAWGRALEYARTGLAKDCQGLKVEDGYIAAKPGGVDFVKPGDKPPPGAKGRIGMTEPEGADTLEKASAWVEVWPITLCGQDRTVGVVFAPVRDSTNVMYTFMPIWTAGGGPENRPAHAP